MNKITKRSIRDRVRAIVKAAQDKPMDSICVGLEVRDCRDCGKVAVLKQMLDKSKTSEAMLHSQLCVTEERLKHLLESDYISSFDEKDIKTHAYKRDIQDADNALHPKECNNCGKAIYFDRVSQLPDCNTCGKRKTCEYAPSWGEYTRINCPLWKEDENK